jgi:hypothetical protein
LFLSERIKDARRNQRADVRFIFQSAIVPADGIGAAA